MTSQLKYKLFAVDTDGELTSVAVPRGSYGFMTYHTGEDNHATTEALSRRYGLCVFGIQWRAEEFRRVQFGEGDKWAIWEVETIGEVWGGDDLPIWTGAPEIPPTLEMRNGKSIMDWTRGTEMCAGLRLVRELAHGEKR